MTSAIVRAITPDAVTSPSEIAKMLERTPKVGYAEIQEANVLGASGVAAPVFGCGGEVLGALSIGVPTAFPCLPDGTFATSNPPVVERGH